MENKNFFLCSIILGALILFGAWYFQVFTDLEVPSRLLAAILGVVITAIITQLLLSGQTNKEVVLNQEQQKWQADQDKKKQEHQEKLAKETREWQEKQTLQTKEWQEQQDKKTEQWRIEHDRNNTVFCEKLKIYKNFLDTLYSAVKDEGLTDKEKIELQYKTSLVAMHCEPQNILELSEAVKKVITMMCKPDRQRSSNDNVLLETLFDVVEALRKDLYAKDDIKTFSDDLRRKTINNFNDAYSNAKEGNAEVKDVKPHLSVDLNVLSDISCMLKSDKIEPSAKSKSNEVVLSEKSKVYNTYAWDMAVKTWQDKDKCWLIKAMESEDCPLLITRNDGNPGMIDMGFYDNHYFIQARYEGDWNFSKCLKWDNGGRRQREMWWEYPTLSMDVPKGGFIDKFKSSSELQQQIIKRVEYLQDIILKTHRTHLWMQAVGEPKNWNLFTWYWTTLACESQSEEEGKIYMDTLPVDGKDAVAIQLGNRANSVEQLKDTLTHIGLSDRLGEIQEDGCFITLEEVAFLKPEDVGERLKHWVCLISQNVLNEK